MKTRFIKLPKNFNRGDHLFASTKNKKGPHILLIGHLDTVFELSSSFQKYKQKNNIAYGPGVNDMKGGLIVILSALESLYKADLLKNINLTVALMSDEESSSPMDHEGFSRKELIQIAKKSKYALGFEYAVETINKATIARRSYTGWTINIEAISGHSSKIFSKDLGYGANYALSQILTDIRNSVKGKKYLTINPGFIAGGTSLNYDKDSSSANLSGKSNIIAKKAMAKGDIRAMYPEQLKFVKDKFHKLITHSLPGTKAKISFGESYPPMPPTEGNKKLLNMLSLVSEDLGYG